MTFLAIYLDNMILTRNNKHEIHNIKKLLDTVFGIKDLSDLHYFLGIEVINTETGLILHHNKFLKEML